MKYFFILRVFLRFKTLKKAQKNARFANSKVIMCTECDFVKNLLIKLFGKNDYLLTSLGSCYLSLQINGKSASPREYR
ncbi:hypothetical protein D6V18_14925 [Vibrio cholerae]|nr:hypothetical protein [Vibrio cholerae]EGR4195685.1 hypothetical protein [Vibrio cholerae]KAA1197479.1 hypothetical protein F0M12_14330 [Vibrio cholerae]MBO1402151.1 hypothetical protein [Vibrio cholerae]MUH69943.1 hypothetical protein [Vibrio cholerae]